MVFLAVDKNSSGFQICIKKKNILLLVNDIHEEIAESKEVTVIFAYDTSSLLRMLTVHR